MKKQCIGSLVGIIIYFLFCSIDSKRLARWGFALYFVSLIMLVYTLIGGFIGMGGQRWISLYFFRFQPSEVIKLFLPVFIATYFSEQNIPKYTKKVEIPFKDFVLPLLALVISFLLIVKQPDLGTALVVLFSGLIILWFVGLSRRFFIVLGVISLLGAPVFWKMLKPYQKKRILVLFGYGDVNKERYQVEQSKIAIGSGGLLGKGLLRGSQNKLGFLPEDHNDFIFSVICEEFGFIGALFVILLYGALFTRIIFLVMQVKSFFQQIIAIGLLIHIMLSVCINIGMVMGMLPVVGMSLPLFSYGITHLWVVLASFGWLNNIVIRRFYYGR